MGWFRDKFTAEPIECPRGWGTVTFVPSVFVLPPIFVLDRKCPIAGVDHCTKCRHPVKVGSVEELRLQLVELDALRGSTLSEGEFRIRRRLMVDVHVSDRIIPGQAAATAALILGPLGVITVGAGWYLSKVVSLGFMGLMGGGLVLSALGAGLAGISMVRRRALRKPDDPPSDALLEHRHDLEARLGRAEEELEFFHELHAPESAGELPSPKEKDR